MAADPPSPPPAAAGRRFGWPDAALAAAVFGLALFTRLHFLYSSPDRAWPHSAWFQGDATVWADWAGALGKGEAFERGLPIHTPGIGYVLHWLGYTAQSQDYTGAKVLWCIASALGCALTYLAVRAETCRRAAAIAGVLLAFSFSSMITATSLNGEAVYSLLIPAIVWGTIRLSRRPGVVLAAGVGVLHGLATLIRAEHTLLLVMLLGWMAWRQRGVLLRVRSAVRPTLKAAAAVALVLAASVAVCLPWTIRAAESTAKFNRVPIQEPEYTENMPRWSADARALIESLPAFARHDNVGYITFLARQRGVAEITPQYIRDYFQGTFKLGDKPLPYWPEPLKVWNLVCSQGPLCFALGNHPKSGGGFTKAGLETPLAEDPTLNFSYPPHLYLYNHGFLAGLDWMRDDPSRWMRLAGRKLAIFWEGAAQGLTGQNWPLGRTGVRRAVDTFTARSPWSGVWGGVLGGLMLVGLVVASKRRIGGVWVLVLLSKVITNVAFYGYARQAASVIGAFDVFIALGIDGLLTLALRPLPAGKLPRWGRLVWLAPVAAMVVLELRAGEQKLWPVYGPSGPPSPSPLASVPPPSKPYYWAAPRWGSGAFESVYDLDMQRRR